MLYWDLSLSWNLIESLTFLLRKTLWPINLACYNYSSINRPFIHNSLKCIRIILNTIPCTWQNWEKIIGWWSDISEHSRLHTHLHRLASIILKIVNPQTLSISVPATIRIFCKQSNFLPIHDPVCSSKTLKVLEWQQCGELNLQIIVCSMYIRLCFLLDEATTLESRMYFKWKNAIWRKWYFKRKDLMLTICVVVTRTLTLGTVSSVELALNEFLHDREMGGKKLWEE